jgi:hypothetical protein
LTQDQLMEILVQLLLFSRSSLDLAGLPLRRVIPANDHPFAAPPNPSPPGWCVCGRCVIMPTERENVCCGKRTCTTTEEYFRSTVIDPDVLQVQIRYRADFLDIRPDYGATNHRKSAYRQYVLGQYGYLGQGQRRIAPSCCVVCIRHWYPSPTGDYMGYRSN